MKAAWAEMAEEYAETETGLVAEVDCTGGGKTLCLKHNIHEVPAVRYGNPGKLKDYERGRGFGLQGLMALAEWTLECGPVYTQHCDDKQLGDLAKFSKMSFEELQASIKEVKDQTKRLEKDLDALAKTLAQQSTAAEKKKDEEIERLKSSGDSSSQENVDAIEKLEKDFKALVKDLRKQYSDAQRKKVADVEHLEETSGLAIMRNVDAHSRHTWKSIHEEL